MGKDKEENMFEKLSVAQTRNLVSERKTKSTCGMTNELRNQFAVMIPGESFIYPLREGLTARQISARIRGTCYSLKVRVRTKKMESGVLVIYKGGK